MGPFFNKFRRDIAGVGWITLGVVAALSLASFSPEDPSLNSIGKAASPQNYFGYFGAYISDLLFQILGLGAWILVAAALRMGIVAFRENKTRPSRNDLLVGSLFVFNLIGLLGLYFGEKAVYQDQIPVAGLFGVALSSGLVKVFNKVGVAVLLWSCGLIFLIYYTQKPLKEVFAHPLHFIDRLKTWWESKAWGALRKNLSLNWLTHKSPITNRFVPINGPVPTEPGLGFAPEEELGRESQNIEAKPADREADLEQETDGEKESAGGSTDKFVLITDALERVRLRKKVAPKKSSVRIENWELPKLAMLENPPNNLFKVDQRLIAKNTQILEDKLAQFNVNGQVVAVRPGPAVTMFEFKPNADVKISRITELADDLSLALSAESVRIIAPLPGRDVVGIETSNPKRETVFLKESLEDPIFWDEKVKLPLALGKQANGETKIVDLRKMPHLLVAGTTGSGKSVFVVSVLSGLLFKHSPKTLRLILIDPKQVDLAAFHNVPHLLMPPIREAKKAIVALKWAIREMEKRYRSMSKFGARGLESYNEIIEKLSSSDREKHEAQIAQLEEAAPHEAYYCQQLPYTVVVVEEFGDLMAVDKANVEQSVVRLAQMARACGIHLILAMQSPRKDVVTGLIKTNIPGRISFKVASKLDSRIILDDSGAERLLANGDMLFLAPGISKPERHHGAWISESDIQGVTKFWSEQAPPEFDKLAMKMLEGSGGGYDFAETETDGGAPEDTDEMYNEILAYVSSQKEMSASLLQRRYRLGYPRASRLIELFEREGVVGPANGSKPRQVLVNKV